MLYIITAVIGVLGFLSIFYAAAVAFIASSIFGLIGIV